MNGFPGHKNRTKVTMCPLTFRPCSPSLPDIFFMDEEDSLDEGFHLFFNDKGILWTM